MDVNNAEQAQPSKPMVPEGLSTLLMIGGGLVAAYGAITGLDPGLDQAAPLLHKLGTLPIGLWTIEFLINSVFGVIIGVLSEVLNKFTVIGGITAFVGYALLPASSKQGPVG
jgi:hypothetical protein